MEPSVLSTLIEGRFQDWWGSPGSRSRRRSNTAGFVVVEMHSDF
jgi:hypothetical protein